MSRAKWSRSKIWMAVGALLGVGVLLVGALALAPFNQEARLRRLDIEALRRVARAQPNNARVFWMLGRRLRQAGRLYEAAVMTSRAYDLSQGEAHFAAARVGALTDRREYEAAAEMAQQAVARWPQSGEVRAQLSRVHAATGRFADALHEAEAAVRLAPGAAEAWQTLGNACALNKRPEQAFRAFERARSLEPRDAELLADEGAALMKYGRIDQAAAVLNQAREVAPQAARPAALLGELMASRARTANERAAARSLLELAVARAPEATDSIYQLALLELRDRRGQEAVRLLQRLLTLDPSYGEAHLTLARAYQQLGERGSAESAFAAWQRFSDYRRQAAHLVLRLRRRPNDRELLQRLARLHRRYGNLPAATAYERQLQDLPVETSSQP